MSHDHDATPVEYNPPRDYAQFMQWSKYGIVICIAIVIAMRFLIG